MYFEEKGKINTEQCIKRAIEVAKERNIKHIVVATSTGDTAKLLKEVSKDINIVCVTLAYGYGNPGKNKITEETINELKTNGFKVLSTTHVLSGAERALSNKFGGISPVEVMAYTLRMFGQGTKVAVEVAVMAMDAGLIPAGEEIISIAGSGKGADSALIMTPAHASNILETKINEIICKPRNF